MQVDDIKDRKNIELYLHETYGKIVVPSIPHKDREYGGHLMISPHEKVHHMNELFHLIVADINNRTIISRHYTQDKATTLSVHR